MRAWWRQTILPILVYWLYRIWTGTWRVTLHEPDELKRRLSARQPVIFAHWHGDELAIVQLVPTYRIATMTSTSSDGALIDKVILSLGGATSRGSSTRGAVSALKGLLRLLKQGHNASMAVDGPKGPLHQVKPGVFEISRVAGAAIVPVGVATNSALVFSRSWNRAHLPWPFARVVVWFGAPWPVLDRDTDARSEELGRSLAQALSDAHHQAAKLIAD